jgi:septum site-determining protein MinD
MGKAIIVSSGKGGVGKTSIVINIGAALTALGKKVAIVDGSLTTPDIALHLGIPFHIKSLAHVLQHHTSLNAACFHHKTGISIIPGSVHNNLLKEFESNKLRHVLNKLKKEYDYVLVDCAAGLGREATSAIKNCDNMLVVVNPELTSVVNASKTIQLAKTVHTTPLGIILNRTGRYSKELSQDTVLSLMHNIPLLGIIPEDTKLSLATKKEETVINHYPRSKASKSITNIAHTLAGKPVKQKRIKKKIVKIKKRTTQKRIRKPTKRKIKRKTNTRKRISKIKKRKVRKKTTRTKRLLKKIFGLL